MTERIGEVSPRLKARIAGALYLGTMVGSGFGFSVISSMIVRGDAAATAARILASEPLFRLGFVADLVAGGCYIGVTAILYGLLKPVSRTVSLAAALFSLAGCAVGAANSVNLLAPLVFLGGAPYLAVFGPDQLRALTLTSLRLYEQGHNISIFFFGIYCALLGRLVFRSTFLPRILGVLLAIAGLGWLTEAFATFLSPPLASHLFPYILAPGALGEGALTLWLLVVGVNGPRWKRQAGVAEALAP